MDLRKLVSKQDVSVREGAGLEILNRDVGILEWGTKNEPIGMKGYISMGMYPANRKGIVRNKSIVG